MLLIGRYLLAEHGPGYSVWFLEADHTVLPKRLAMMLVRVDMVLYLPSYQNSNVEQHFFGISDNIFYMGTQNGSRLEKC